MSTQKEIQAQYDGFNSSPLLWNNSKTFQLNQYIIDSPRKNIYDQVIESKVRLGKRVELFLLHQLKNNEQISNIHENIQIQKEKITLGELDFIFLENTKPIHLEAIFKFYLYDPNVGSSEIDHWIGPNRNDSLRHKLDKLITKQLPRLRLPETMAILQKKGFQLDDMKQYVHFQAQLFVPYGEKQPSFNLICPDSIKGFYISLNQLDKFKKCQFYIPTKVNWLANPTADKNFIGIEAFKQCVSAFLGEKRSPLCWMKDENNLLTKFFLVWW
ncbi:MAG TPA: DUF1853 family protein [Crocinitomicaceae bacterium]|nr:DUF1853 family protein [Crocinitomicaceae bacterium]